MTDKTKISNYEKMKNSMAGEFLKYDQEKMIHKFGLDYDENNLYIKLLDRLYRISRQNGAVSWSKGPARVWHEAGYNEAMTIYDVLCYSKENCHLANEWVNTGSLSSIQGGSLTKSGDFFQDAGAYFDGKSGQLAHACEILQGKKAEKGDVAYEMPLFPFLPVLLRFWESDEEFPASLQIFTDKNILNYMHYETLMFAISYLLERLKGEIDTSL